MKTLNLPLANWPFVVVIINRRLIVFLVSCFALMRHYTVAKRLRKRFRKLT